MGKRAMGEWQKRLAQYIQARTEPLILCDVVTCNTAGKRWAISVRELRLNKDGFPSVKFRELRFDGRDKYHSRTYHAEYLADKHGWVYTNLLGRQVGLGLVHEVSAQEILEYVISRMLSKEI